jgi:hypothetical protein
MAIYRDDVSGVYTDEYGNPVNPDQSFGSRPDTAQNAAVNGGLLSYLWDKGKAAINNPEAPWNAQSGLLAVLDTAALPAKAIGQGLLALPDRIQTVTQSAQRGDYAPATDDAMSVAFSGLPIGAATAPAGVTGMFAGKMAKTANLDKLSQAEKMAASGAARDAIWGETGWFQAPDGHWKWEINDSGARMGALPPSQSRTETAQEWLRSQGRTEKFPLGDPRVPADLQSRALAYADANPQASKAGLFSVLDHPELQAAYPDMASTQIQKELSLGGVNGTARHGLITVGGSEVAGKAPDHLGVTLHEGQHIIQRNEGFGVGGMPEEFTQQADAMLARDALSWRNELLRKKEKMPGADIVALENAAVQDYQKMGAMDWLPSREARDLASQPDILHSDKYPDSTSFNDLKKLVAAYGLDKNTAPHDAKKMYRSLAGEAEARAVQARMNLTPEQRAARPPWLDYDVPENQQIVRFGGNGPSSMVDFKDGGTYAGSDFPEFIQKHLYNVKDARTAPRATFLMDEMPYGARSLLFDGNHVLGANAKQLWMEPQSYQHWNLERRNAFANDPSLVINTLSDPQRVGPSLTDGWRRGLLYNDFPAPTYGIVEPSVLNEGLRVNTVATPVNADKARRIINATREVK